MLSFAVRLWKQVKRIIRRVVRGAAERIEVRVRRVWAAHRARVARDATYAAVTATVLAGALGLVPITDVLSAVLAAVLGVFANQRGRSRAMSSWNDDDWM